MTLLRRINSDITLTIVVQNVSISSIKALSVVFFHCLTLLLKTECYKMSFQIFYKDGHMIMQVDEYSRLESMGYIIDEERCALETVSSHTQHYYDQPMANNFELVLMQDGNTKDDVDTCMKELSTK
jgi:transketolase N-terminal domain/subunit